MVGAGDDDFSLRCWIVVTIELSGGEHVRERGRDDHAADEQRQRVRKLHLDRVTSICSLSSHYFAGFTIPAVSSARKYSLMMLGSTGPNSALTMSRIFFTLRLPSTKLSTS